MAFTSQADREARADHLIWRLADLAHDAACDCHLCDAWRAELAVVTGAAAPICVLCGADTGDTEFACYPLCPECQRECERETRDAARGR